MMKLSPTGNSFLRISLRQLLLLTVFVAVAFASLRFANEFWWAAVGLLTGMLFLAAVVQASVDRGRRQAFALGFAICCGAYIVVVSGYRTREINLQDNNELDPYEGILPTTRLLRPLFESVVRRKTQGYSLPQPQPGAAMKMSPSGTGGLTPSMGAPGGPGVGFVPFNYLVEVPARREFMLVGHSLWAILLGYLGGLFALFLVWRRTRGAGGTVQ